MKKQPVTNAHLQPAHPTTLDALLGQLRVLIQEARQQVLVAVDLVACTHVLGDRSPHR